MTGIGKLSHVQGILCVANGGMRSKVQGRGQGYAVPDPLSGVLH